LTFASGIARDDYTPASNFHGHGRTVGSPLAASACESKAPLSF
jgi:hypothetical protein